MAELSADCADLCPRPPSNAASVTFDRRSATSDRLLLDPWSGASRARESREPAASHVAHQHAGANRVHTIRAVKPPMRSMGDVPARWEDRARDRSTNWRARCWNTRTPCSHLQAPDSLAAEVLAARSQMDLERRLLTHRAPSTHRIPRPRTCCRRRPRPAAAGSHRPRTRHPASTTAGP